MDTVTGDDALSAEVIKGPVLASYNANITLRGNGKAPTIMELESAIERALEELGGVSRANKPLVRAKASATRTDR